METEPKEQMGVAGPDPGVSGDSGTGDENEGLKKTKKQADSLKEGDTKDPHDPKSGGPKKPAPKLVQRVTALRGQSIVAVQPKKPVRSHTEKDLLAEKFDIPYPAVEKAVRNVICAMIERQDLAIENLLLKIDDLEYRVDDLEALLEENGLLSGNGEAR